MTEIRSFTINVPQADLDDLRDRIARTRWATDMPGAGWDYGVPTEYLRELVDYWQHGYDWRAAEAKLNELPQFITQIDGQQIHFVHVRSAVPGAVPLILSHGWPASILEYTGIIEALTDPSSADGLAFDVVIPSMPGCGFSGPTWEPGWDGVRTARAWAVLMDRLGYNEYGAVGNDWGGVVTQLLSDAAPDRLLGMHLTQLLAFPDDSVDVDTLTEDEQTAMTDMGAWQETHGAYLALQSHQPQTLAHALTDSPVGLLGWFSQVLGPELSRDFVLTNVMIHWLTGTVASAMRVYYEGAHHPLPDGATDIPLGVAQFHEEFRGIPRFADEFRTVVSWNNYDEPGHYAAQQYPDLFVADLRQFFSTVLHRRGSAVGEPVPR